MKKTRLGAATALALGILPAHAVQLNPDGLGQALIYPYYTVRTAAGGNAFNTYLTVVNTTADAKAVRVRFREGRAGRPVLDMNLFLSPNDVWAAAMVPTAAGTQLITNDTSCTDPAFVASGSGTPALPLHANGYTGSGADGFGDTLDRTREGFLEMIEMAVLTESSARAVTHNASGVPENCAAIRATAGPTVAAPSAGLSGTLTLINVNSGQDFTLDATALDGLGTRAFYRPPGDPYPDWNALEIDPVSLVLANGHAYRSAWTRPVDAVSAVLMQVAWFAEYIMDNASASLTDIVATVPTRHHYVTAATASAPFTAPVAWRADCGTGDNIAIQGEALGVEYFNREEQGGVVGNGSLLPFADPDPVLCAAAGVASARNGAIHLPADTSRTGVFGSTTRGLGRGGQIPIRSSNQNGWIGLVHSPRADRPLLVSQPSSQRTNLVTGQVTVGSHTYGGLPLVGFFARTFANGTLGCGAGSCQGNYGGAFPLRSLGGILPR